MAGKRILQNWEEYKSQCFPSKKSEEDEESLKNAFYAGVMSALTMLAEEQSCIMRQMLETDLIEEIQEFSLMLNKQTWIKGGGKIS